MKLCSTCGNTKPLSDFNRKGKSYQSKCRSCQKEWYALYYKNSPNEKSRLATRREQDYSEKRRIIREAKNVPCFDCGNTYPSYVMDFDHRVPGEKKFTIARIQIYSIKHLMEEIQKCDVVCSNCHRERTWGAKVDSADASVLL